MSWFRFAVLLVLSPTYLLGVRAGVYPEKFPWSRRREGNSDE